MKRALIALCVATAVSPVLGQSVVPIKVEIREGTRAAATAPRGEIPNEAGPCAGIPARQAAGAPALSAESFVVRASMESGKVRVAVYAAPIDTTCRDLSLVVATFDLGLDQSREVVEVARFGAVPVTVRASAHKR